jgi:hypothetical protein
LGIRHPPGFAVAVNDVPLIPTAIFIFIANTTNYDEGLVFENAFGADHDRAGVVGIAGDFADFFKVDVGANEDAAAVGASGLYGLRVAEYDGGTTLRTI